LPIVTITAPGNATIGELRQLVLDAIHAELNWQGAVWVEPFIPYDFRWMVYRGTRGTAEGYMAAVLVNHAMPDTDKIEDPRQLEMLALDAPRRRRRTP
jgi:hypothetical protein